MLNLGQFGTVRISKKPVKNKWRKYRFELCSNYNNQVKLRIEKGIVYYQVPLSHAQWIVDFLTKEKAKDSSLSSSVQDMAKKMKRELEENNLLTSIQQKDGMYLIRCTYETVRISDKPAKHRSGYQYDLRQDVQKKSIHKNKGKCYTVSFNHYKWIIENIKRVHETKEQHSISHVAANIKYELLQEGIRVNEHQSSSSNSIYLELDSKMLGSIRVSDHKTKNKHNKYNICPQYRYVGKGRRTDNYSFSHHIPIEKWKTVIHLVTKDRLHKMKKYGETAYKFKVETNQL